MTNINKPLDLNKHGGKTIQERTDYRKILREKKLEALRNKYQEDESQLTFKPDINHKSKNIKRSLNDLYVYYLNSIHKTDHIKFFLILIIILIILIEMERKERIGKPKRKK